MRVAQRRLLRLLALLLALSFVAAACGNDNTPSASGDPTTTAADGGTSGVDYSALTGTINGSGSSFADGFYQQVISSMADQAPDLTVNYNPVGSGQGKKDFAAKLNDFAGTDSLVKPEEAPAGSYLYVPTAAAPITVSYNLDGVTELNLSATTLAKIFQGEITTWDDAAIKAENAGAKLPSTKIVIVHRADGSGTTSAFTKYLTKAAGADWKLGAGDTVNWPAGSQAGQKNTGVAQLIKDTKGAIGYVDFADAKATGLSFAKIKNKDGNFAEATLAGASAALAGATAADDLTLDALDAAGADTYPITAVTYILLRPTYDATVGANVKGFVTYVLTDGQSEAASVDYAKLPAALATKALAQLDKVTVG
ncbi:MAG: phosphate transporter periplasmic phosphate-binding protein [Acidimicrobiales bacterium]|nr:phosphate transporter periplasmic phosphate-binding protein [Acidimicrobiales bacterium]